MPSVYTQKLFWIIQQFYQDPQVASLQDVSTIIQFQNLLGCRVNPGPQMSFTPAQALPHIFTMAENESDSDTV